jgi:hypothetical protein
MASDLPWPDRVLTDAAARLGASGDPAAAEALLTFSELTLRYGSSWWDGHDDYIYDVELALVTDPAGTPPLAEAGQAVPGAFAKAVGTFVDEIGELRRGDLVKFEALVGEVGLDPARLDGRRRHMAERARVVGG